MLIIYLSFIYLLFTYILFIIYNLFILVAKLGILELFYQILLP